MSQTTFPFQSSYARELRDEGKSAERARSVLRALETRGVVVDAAVRERVQSCVDLDVLDAWFLKAMAVERAEQLFD